jgi:hypothetical protein
MKLSFFLTGGISIFFIFSYEPVIAQAGKKGSWNTSAGIQLNLPNSGLQNTHRVGGGVSIKGEYVFAKHASATISGGYQYLEGKIFNGISNASIQAIPFTGGFRYYLGSAD